MKKHHFFHRIIVGILILCIIFESGAAQVLASESDSKLTYSEGSNDISSDSNVADSNNTSLDNNPDNSSSESSNNSANNNSESSNDSDNNNSESGSNPDNNNSDSIYNSDNNNSDSDNNNLNPNDNSDNDNSDSGNDSDNNNSDSDNNPDNNNSDSGNDSDNNNSDSDNNPDNNNSDSGNDSDNNSNSDNDSTDLNENETDPENETDNPNNEPTETESTDTDSTDTESIDTDSTDTNFSSDIDIASAEKAFKNILSNKDVMALIYLTDVYHVRSLADGTSNIVADIESGHTVYLLGVTITKEAVWYKVSFWLNGSMTEGYVERRYLAYSDEDWLKWDEEYLYKLADNGIIDWSAIGGISSYALSYEDIDQFPAGYQDALTQLKALHSNWTFVPMNTKLDFETAVTNEMGVKSLIQNTTSNASKGWVGEACPTTSGWYYATRDAVSYHMDPRNFLTETYIFQFEQLTFNSSYHTEAAIQTFLNSTFMKGTLPDDSQKRTYAKAFYEIGSARKLSPIHLASRVYQEQGQGTSGLISGTYPGYEGYYNYFNVQANGSTDKEVITNGLTYAKKMGWNTRYKSLEGGAATIGNNYILKGQDTLYLEKFNVNSNSPNGLYEHQYMQNIQAPSSESASTKKMYSGASSLNSAFVFKIPVYNNMPVTTPLQAITLNKEEVTLRRPDTVVKDIENLSSEELSSNISSIELQVLFDPEDTTDDKTITWTSSNKKVAVVENGVVTAVGIGEATITAKASKAGNKTAKCKVTVIAPVYKIEFSSENNTDTILAGQSVNLFAEYFPKDTTSDTTVIWQSSDTSVATVARTKGSVRGISAGTADITATIGNYSASHRITVEGCSVTFKDSDNTTDLKTISTSYGKKVAQDDFPIMDNTADSVFVGWYTGADGTGSRFDYNTPIHQKETVVYPCFKPQGKGFYVIPLGDQTYTGSAIKPQLLVYDSILYEDDDQRNGDTQATPLVLNKDYTVSYKNNKKAASADAANPPTIIVKGKGNYTGTETITFNIVTKALTDTDISVDNVTAAYNGKTIKSSPIIYRNGKKLKKNTDYKLTYPLKDAGAYRNAGTYPIIITGTGGYHGTLTIYETISPKVLLSKAAIAPIPSQLYDPSKIDKENGIGIEPPLTVTYKKKPLTESTDGGVTGDYVITYKNNFNTGTATATITAVDNEENIYSGSKSINFKITAPSINKAVISGIAPKTYTGLDEDVMQENISVSLSGNTLTESHDGGVTGDYVLEYKNINKAGTATVIIKGINAYSGKKKKTYKITACDLSQIQSDDISFSYCTEDKKIDNPDNIISVDSLDNITTPYMKGSTKPTVLLSYKGRELVPGKDYTVKYKNNKAVTTTNTPANKMPQIIITGKGLFKGKISGTFRITDGAMSNDNTKITMTAADVVYKEKKGAYKTKVTLTDANGKKLKPGKDYDKNLRYTYVNEEGASSEETVVNENDIPQAGTAIRVTVMGIGAYAGNENGSASKSAIYYIVSADIAKAKVSVTAQTYNNGRAVTLSKDDITVTLNGSNLTLGKDYEIIPDTYVNNYNKGKASVVIKGTGKKYGGTKKISFNIKGKAIKS